MSDRANIKPPRTTGKTSETADEVTRSLIDRWLAAGFSTRTSNGRVRLQVPDATERDDVVQDVFARLAAASKRGITVTAPYARTVCRSVVIDRFRVATTESARAVRDTDDRLLETGELASADDQLRAGSRGLAGSPESNAIRSATREFLTRFVAELSTQELRLLQLLARDEMSQRQAADQLKIQRNHVRKMQQEIRTRLMRELKKEGLIDSLDPSAVFAALLTVALTWGPL